jgi:hypothetical protein
VRYCQSPDETFFLPEKQCVKIGGSTNILNPCPFANQAAYDSKDNTAFCDCVEDERGLVFYQPTGKCYQQNVQGPCANGEWLVLSDGDDFHSPKCEKIPGADCPADGQHVFWAPPSSGPVSPGCWELNVRGPCPVHWILIRNKDLMPQCVVPTAIVDGSSGPEAPFKRLQSCSRGSSRSQNGNCVSFLY